MSIWHQDISVEMLNEHMRRNMLEHLDIEFIEIGEDFIKARMPVDQRTTQPYGILHGGASVALAESLGSAAGTMCLDINEQICVGLEVNANHLRAVGGGQVIGVAKGTDIVCHQTHIRWSMVLSNNIETDDAGKSVLAYMSQGVLEDIPIWEEKIYQPNPVLCDGDGPIARNRKWFEQFYITE